MSSKCGGGCGPIIVQPPAGAADTVDCGEGQALLVSVCDSESPGEEQCINTSSLLLCDLPDDGEGGPAGATVTDITASDPHNPGVGTEPLPGGAQALWNGGTLTIPADSGPGPGHSSQHLRLFAATVQADRPVCDTGIATVTASIHVERTGPDPGFALVGSWNMWSAGTHVSRARPVAHTPVGYSDVLTVSATVPAAVLAAGDVELVGYLETYHGPNHAGGWVVDAFTVNVEYDQAGCSTQIYAQVTTECDTGQVLSISYTTLDGAPYTPQGTVGQCGTVIEALPPAAPGSEPCRYVDTLEVCRCDDTTGDGQPDTQYVELYGVPCDGSPPQVLWTYMAGDPAIEYEPVSPVPCPTFGEESP